MSSVSGVKCHTDVVTAYNDFKKATSQYNYIVAMIEEKFIVIEEAHKKEEGDDDVDDKGIPKVYKKFEEKLIKGGCRYGFFIPKWTSPGGPRDMVVMIQYCDDKAPPKMKLQYSTSKGAIVKPCQGIGAVIEANDKDEASYGEIIERCMKMKRWSVIVRVCVKGGYAVNGMIAPNNDNNNKAAKLLERTDEADIFLYAAASH